MQKTNNLQEVFLTQARKQKIPVTMFLVNGFQLRGLITGFDCFVVVLDSEGKQSSSSRKSTVLAGAMVEMACL